MGFGSRIWNLWRLRRFVVVSASVAVVMAIWSIYSISLLPPKLTPRSLQMATATTHVIVDTPTSTILDLRQNSYDFDAMTQRAILLGNVIANGAVRESIAREAHIPTSALRVTAPFTRKQPRVVGTDNPKRTSDIFASMDQYRLNIQANPSVPMLDIYAQAPDAKSAEILANSAVDGLRRYLANLANAQQIPTKDQLRLLQLGRADSSVINPGVEWQVALVVFLITFALGCASTILIARVIRGFRAASLAEQRATA